MPGSVARGEAVGAEVLQDDVPIQVVRLPITIEIEEARGGPREGLHTLEVQPIHDLVEIVVPRARRLGAVASAPGPASVRVWEIMSRGRGPQGGRPLPEGANVALYEAGWPCQVATGFLPLNLRSVSFTASR